MAPLARMAPLTGMLFYTCFQKLLWFCRVGDLRKDVLLLVLIGATSAVCISSASAHVITSSEKACHWLHKNSLQLSSRNREIFAEARQLSGSDANMYLDRSSVISRVAHIPDAPYLTAIVGKQAQCVAISPVWFDPLTTPERLWLTLVGIAGLQHRHTYKMMLHAAENPPTGLFSGIARWWGRRTADHAILASEKQATQWLPTYHRNSADAALVQLQRLPDFATDHWLPKTSAQSRAIQQG